MINLKDKQDTGNGEDEFQSPVGLKGLEKFFARGRGMDASLKVLLRNPEDLVGTMMTIEGYCDGLNEVEIDTLDVGEQDALVVRHLKHGKCTILNCVEWSVALYRNEFDQTSPDTLKYYGLLEYYRPVRQPIFANYIRNPQNSIDFILYATTKAAEGAQPKTYLFSGGKTEKDYKTGLTKLNALQEGIEIRILIKEANETIKEEGALQRKALGELRTALEAYLRSAPQPRC